MTERSLNLNNPNMSENLYHLGLSAKDNLQARFGDVKFVCLGGKSSRMKDFANHLFDILGKPANSEFKQLPNNGRELKDVSAPAGRYCMYKVGPCISVNHGIGIASTSVVLHEIFKLLHFAKCKCVKFIRIGTSGGLGLEPGSLVVTHQPYDELLQPAYTQIACGKPTTYDCKCDEKLTDDILRTASLCQLKAVKGNTLSTNDFYEAQGRLDGAFCSFTYDDKMQFLRKIHDDLGVKNIEMESVLIAGMCRRAGFECAILCVTILDRLVKDEVDVDASKLSKFEQYPQLVIAQYIQRCGTDESVRA